VRQSIAIWREYKKGTPSDRFFALFLYGLCNSFSYGRSLDIKERICDPFLPTKDAGEGAGLGLYRVTNIVQEHQGRMQVATDFDQGARIIISFPQFSPTARLFSYRP
jgi:Histidine kinase-, DNA gyrase B-, and HSP90-like ATPase